MPFNLHIVYSRLLTSQMKFHFSLMLSFTLPSCHAEILRQAALQILPTQRILIWLCGLSSLLCLRKGQNMILGMTTLTQMSPPDSDDFISDCCASFLPHALFPNILAFTLFPTLYLWEFSLIPMNSFRRLTKFGTLSLSFSWALNSTLQLLLQAFQIHVPQPSQV